MAEFCNPCRVRHGRLRAGVHRLQGEAACEECFHGGNAEAIARCRKSRVNVDRVIEPSADGVKEEKMECKTPGCGKRLNANNQLGYCTPCRKAGKYRSNGNGRAGGGDTRKRTALARVKESRDTIMIPFTPEVSFAIWRGLPAQTQAALVAKLSEVE